MVLRGLLVAAWAGVVVFTSLAFLQMRRESKAFQNPRVPFTTPQTGLAFPVFMFTLMPALFALLPMIATMLLTDVYCAPSVMAWLVLLLSSFLQFNVNTIPGRVAWSARLTATALPIDLDATRVETPPECRRNV